ncbi:MAG: MarC family protein [Puniceicoccales bacterium]|jgi:multiple antibiotic resistance protein|nr:MarC family protein [Puniceicoccales bacterium]
MPFSAVLSAFVKLLIIANPASGIPLLLAFTQGQTTRERTRAAAVACSVAFGVLAVIAVSGMWVFHLFGVSLQAFKIAGGSYLMLVSIPMLVDEGSTKAKSNEPSAILKKDFAVTPLGIPIICGPGMISTTLLVGSDYPGMVGTAGLLVAIALALGSFFLLLWLASIYSKHISDFVLTLAGRLTGIFVAAIGLLIALSGIGMFLEKGSAL